ncbi:MULTISPECIES: hypothetical protein [unclassified Paenibacillus]|uniref:hypothetical protein n=1 Tax=unclassified Paenibacillus TaxID=185978 RepID=UPI00070CA2DF|nr:MULTISPECIES: hypothetical protein [unclassified Paenibacillus]KQX51220.1 hypothetical protein ASD40_35605 [Paenibacillus sp. Root444D2]KRE44251.1 hypothetical protein ASG85_32930 [Paenibacillus sp. Soil724D2]
MISIAILISSLCYGVLFFCRLRKQSSVSDAILMLLLCGFIAGYFVPRVGEKWPTVESLNNYLFTPVSDYIFHLLELRTGEG